MSETCVVGANEKKSVSAWAIIGCAWLAVYLPPVLALFVVSRWKDVSRRLRTMAVLLSFLAPVGFVWIGFSEHSLWTALALPFFGYAVLLMHASFILCWHRHRGLKASILLRTCFWLVLILVTFASVAWLVTLAVHLFFMPQNRF